jgi:guanine deaminase
MTVNGWLLLPTAEHSVRISDFPGHIVIDDGRIIHVDASRLSPSPDFGDESCLISPGFIDAHVHLPQFDSIGIDGLELLDWLARAIFPAEMKWADTDYAASMTSRVGRELLSFGTTGIAAYATSHHLAAQAAIDQLASLGIAGHTGQVLMDQSAPDELLLPAPAALSLASTLKPRHRMAPAVTPRFAVSCSDQLLRGAGELARRTGWLVQTHLAETHAECRISQDLHGGRTMVKVYEDAGLLTQRTVLAHGIHLDDADRACIAGKASFVAHCPTANRFLDAGVMNLERHRRHGVHVCIGSDVGAGPDRSMVRVARAMIDAAKQAAGASSPAPPGLIPSSQKCWGMITAGNADSLGLAQTGSLHLGSHADVVVIRPTKPWRDSIDPLSTLLYAWDDRWIDTVFASGRIGYHAAAKH